MKMYTQIILLLFGFATVPAHILKEPDVNPCLEEYQEPTRKFTNGHGFQYIYRRRPLEIVQKRPGKIQEAADVTVPTPAETQSTPKVTVPTPAAVESTTKVKVSTTPGEESTTKVTGSTTAEAESTTNVTVPTLAAVQSTTKVMMSVAITQVLSYYFGDGRSSVPEVLTSKPNTDKITATKNRRNTMFNAMRERYHNSKNKNSNLSDASRQKREINNKAILEAPSLPELDIQSFPEYVQKMLASKPTVENSNKTINEEENSDSLEDEMEKLFSDDTEIYENPRTYGMKLNNGEGYSWNHINELNKNTYDDTQHISEPVQESTKSQQANITYEKTEKEKLSNIDKEIKPKAMIEGEISNKREDIDLQDKAIPVTPKENYKPNNNSIDNIKNKLNEMLANNIGSVSSLEDNKPRTYGMSLKGGTANIWNDIAGAPHVIIQTTAFTPTINEHTEYKTTTVINDTMEPTYDDTIGQNNTDLEKDGLNKKENNNKAPTLDQNQISHLTTSKPTIYYETTLEPSQKFKRFTEENVKTLKEETDLRDKMEKSFMQILGKFPSFESITSKPNVTTQEEKSDNEPKTYGMNLTGTHGYVWNELAKPGVRYNVGETETSNTTEHINTEPTTSPTTEENQSENSSQTSTTKTETEPPSTEVTTTSTKDATTTLPPVNTEITTESTTTESKPLTTEITSESTTTVTNPQITDITSESTTTETNPKTTEITIVSTTTESNLQTTEEQPQTTEKLSATTEQNDKENTNQEEDNKAKNPVQISLEELLKKDEFWDWMTKWTTAYLEVLKKNIKTMVEDEVEKQLKNYMNKNTENNKDSVNNEENNADDKENDKKPTDIDHSILENKANNTDHKTDKNKENEDDNKSNAEHKESCETNELNQKTNHPSLNVTAKSIYGGAVGNDHVTNIFIFNSNGETNKTIESLLDFIHHKNLTSGNPVNTSADETGNDDKDKNTDETKNSTTDSSTTSNKTKPSNTTPSTKEDKHDKENNDEITTDTSTTKSSTINSEDSKDGKTESKIVDKSTESSENDATTVATNTTTLAFNDDVAEKNVSSMNNSTVDPSTPYSTEATTVKYNNSTEKMTASTSNVIEANTEDYDCATTDPKESALLEINIGAKNTENSNKKCKRKNKPATGLLATLGINLKNPLKGLL